MTALEGEVLPPKLRLHPAEADQARRAAPAFRTRLATMAVLGLSAVAVCGAVAAGTYAVTGAGNRDDSTAQALNRLQDDLGRLRAGVDTMHPAASDLARQDDAVRALKKSVDSLRAELDSLRSTNTAAIAQLSSKLDKADPAPRIADVMARIDKIDRDPSPKLAEITARLDRIEKQVSSPVATGSITPVAKPPVLASVQPVPAPPPPVAPKPVSTVGNWVLRDVYNGIALVEARAGGIREVAPGEFLPGAGEVRSIERRGRSWIVVTSRGIIDNETW